MEIKKISVNIINRNYPPNVGITGESACELADYFIKRNITVNIVHVDANYEGGGSKNIPVGNIYKVKTFYNGKNKFLRLIGNLFEGLLLIKKSISLKPDVTICMTDPPLLNMWAALLLRKKYTWILWAMDLYPEAFVSGKLVSKNNVFYRLINRILKKSKPFHIICLGPCQTNYLQNKYGNNTGFTYLPCGVFSKPNTETLTEIPDWAIDRTKTFLGYCGNIGEAHSEKFLYTIIDNLDPEKYKLILAVYGSKAKNIIDFATKKPGVEIVSSVKRSELELIDVHLASLKKEWINICVPSKTVSSVCAGSAFIYYGFKESDNWVLLNEAGWNFSPTNNVDNNLKDFFSKFTYEDLQHKKSKALQIAIELNRHKQQSFEELYNLIACKEEV